MNNLHLRSSWFVMTMIAILLCSAAALWVGCGEKQDTTSGPVTAASRSNQQSAILDKAHPDIIATAFVQERHTAELMARNGVVGTGVGLAPDGKLAILILTTKEGIPDLPASIEGVQTRVQVVGEIRAFANTKTYRPVPCGVSVGNDRECAAGTIGCVVLKGGTHYALSCNHVFARENAGSIGERIDQPGRYDAKPRCAQAGQVATLAGFVAINFSGGNNTVDCATAQYTTSNLCSMVGGTYTPSSTVVAASLGLPVKKTGRTSGETHGTVSGINVSINVDYGSAGVAHFVNQIMVNGNFIRSGDSGSLMVTDNASANPVGLCFAGGGGGSFMNPIGPVLQSLGVTVCSQ